MIFKKKNPLRKFGLKKKDLQVKYTMFDEIQFGETDEMLRMARYLNRKSRKLKDRRYFVWPAAGPLGHAILVVGRTWT